MFNQPLLRFVNPEAVEPTVDDIDQLQLNFTFVGEPRGSRYLQVAVECHIITASPRYSICFSDPAARSAGEASYDHWIFTDPQALETTLAQTDTLRARLRTVDDDGEFFEDRAFDSTDDGNFSIDLTPSRGEPPHVKEAFVYTNLVIPADPPMLFVLVQRPTYLRAVTFNVKRMWAELEVAYSVTPLYLDFLPSAVTRRVSEYAAETRCRAEPGQGLAFSWGKRGLRNIL